MGEEKEAAKAQLVAEDRAAEDRALGDFVKEHEDYENNKRRVEAKLLKLIYFIE